jgi:hypothetical protein
VPICTMIRTAQGQFGSGKITASPRMMTLWDLGHVVIRALLLNRVCGAVPIGR